jgi:tRNA(Ile)-lysidine synthase
MNNDRRRLNDIPWVVFPCDIDWGDHVLVAVSGGPDSMALLHRLASGFGIPPITLAVAHFDHRLRPDSAEDRRLVERFCRSLGIDCHVGSADVRRAAKERGESLEATARRLRYEFLEKTCDEIGAGKVATDHTRDDDIETVLMRVLRGSGIRGLAGIPARRGRIVRPFIFVARDDILQYCESNEVPYVEDPTNRDTSFERNYIRHEVLPSLRAGFPDAEPNLLRMRYEAEETLVAIRRVTDPILAEHLVEESPGLWRISIDPIVPLDGTARYILFADALYHYIRVERELGRDHYRSLSGLVDGKGIMRSLPGLTARREHDFIVLYHGVPVDERPAALSRSLEVPGQTRLLGNRLCSQVTSVEESGPDWRSLTEGFPERDGGPASAVAYFARDSVAPPFIVRPPAPGDRMQPFGMDGHKKLSDIFIDKKIPYRRRSTVLVVEDRREIVWVVGVTTSESTRVGADAREVVEIRVETE